MSVNDKQQFVAIGECMLELLLYYYRSQSEAKKMFKNLPGSELLNKLSAFDYIYLSGISLAIIDQDSRDNLYQTLTLARQQGTKIIFDAIIVQNFGNQKHWLKTLLAH